MKTKLSEILKDPVHPDQYNDLKYSVCCEDCTHFDASTEECTLQYPVAPHLRRNQLHDLKTSGTMAFCRVMEID